jgi:hypothetical protein
MSSTPERKGYVLAEWGEDMYSEWQDIGGCSCHLGGAPCQSYTHEGHPISLEENDEAWEKATPDEYRKCTDDLDVANLTYGKVYGLYRTKDANSVMLFNDKGRLQYYTLRRFKIKVEEDMSRDQIVNKSTTKDSPEFKVGKWYKCIYVSPSTKDVLKLGFYYKVVDVSDRLKVQYLDDWDLYKSRFDVNSECDFDPIVQVSLGRGIDKQEEKVDSVLGSGSLAENNTLCVGIDRKFNYNPEDVRIFINGEEINPNSNSINQQEEINMSNASNRRIVTVQVFDLDPALEVQHSLVHVFKDVVTEDTNEVTLAELLHTGELVEPLKSHNELRARQDNKEILNKTGKKVKLEPVKVKNLNFKYI